MKYPVRMRVMKLLPMAAIAMAIVVAAACGGGLLIHDTGEGNAAIVNTIFEGNTGHAIYENHANADPDVDYCLFSDNPDGDFYDDDTATGYVGAADINTYVEGSIVENNLDGDPAFMMDSPEGVTGAWTAAPYESATNRTTLTDVAREVGLG